MEHILRSKVREHEVCNYYYQEDFLAHAHDPLKYRVFLGHNWHYALPMMPSGTSTLTLLRHPVQRTMSELEHILRDPNHPEHSRWSHRIRSPVDLAKLEDAAYRFSNVQVRVLGVDAPLKQYRQRVAEGSMTASEAALIISQKRRKAANRETLERAKVRLSHMKAFGLTEHFEESCQWIASVHGFVLEEVPWLNSAPQSVISREELYSNEDIAVMRQLNDLDLELYEYAKSAFSQRAVPTRIYQ